MAAEQPSGDDTMCIEQRKENGFTILIMGTLAFLSMFWPAEGASLAQTAHTQLMSRRQNFRLSAKLMSTEQSMKT